MKKILIILPLCTLILTGCITKQIPATQNQPNTSNQKKVENQVGLANPASVYCTEQGGKLDIRTTADGNQTGFCIFADNSECEEWSYYRGECQPENKLEDITQELKQLFIKKYNKNQDEVTVSVNQQTANYARGGVKFGLNGIGEGGIFLAAKVDNQWQLVFDGNGMIPCSELKQYNFPESMVTDCFYF